MYRSWRDRRAANPTWKQRSRPVAVGIAATAVLCASALAGCSSGNGASSSGSSGQAAGDNPAETNISIGTGGVSTTNADLYIAEVKGYFQKYNVNVNIRNVGATVVAQLESGQLTLAEFAASSAISAHTGDRPVSVIYAVNSNPTASIQVPADSPIVPKATGAETLMELSGKTVAVLGVGTGTYGDAEIFSNYIVAHGGQPLKIKTVANTAAVVPLLETSQVDAAVGLPDLFGADIAAKKVRLLFQGNDPDILQIFGGPVLVGSIWGLQSTLKDNASGVTRFLAAIRLADKFLAESSPAEIAATLEEAPAFNGFTKESLMESISYDKPFYAPANGFISQDLWDTSIKAYSSYGLQQNVNDSQFSYSKFIDTSYWTNAGKLG